MRYVANYLAYSRARDRRILPRTNDDMYGNILNHPKIFTCVRTRFQVQFLTDRWSARIGLRSDHNKLNGSSIGH
jgi:hypothetical protein